MSKSKLTFTVKTLLNLTWPTFSPTRMKKFAVVNRATIHAPLQEETEEKLAKYWSSNKTVGEVLVEADRLYEDKKYMEVYELLNRLKYCNCCEVKWRIARVLYKTAADNVLPANIEEEIMEEAYLLLEEEANEGLIRLLVEKLIDLRLLIN